MMNSDNGRAIYIWGAGSCGADTFQKLKRGDAVKGYIDSDIKKQGGIVNGIKVYSPEILDSYDTDIKPFVIIASTWAEEIEKQILLKGYVEYRDYVFNYNMDFLSDNWIEQYNRFNYISNEFGDALTLRELQDFDDEFWFWMNTKGYREYRSLRNIIPPLPSEDIQVRLTGTFGDASLRYAFNQFRIIKELLGHQNINISQLDTILDFGCGYGRILRFFAKDGINAKMYGTDISKGLIEWCRNNIKFGDYHINNSWPPTDFKENTFSLIFAFSVFSHLSEKSHLLWLEELHRLLKPKGLLIFTIWVHPSKTRKYHEPHFPEYEKLIQDYEDNKYCYSNLLYNGADTYGEALIPITYMKDSWTENFDILEVTDSHPNSPTQNYIVLRKR